MSLPVCIDDTPEKGALVPEAFLRAHWTRLPGGVLTAEVAGRLKELLGTRAETNAQRSTFDA